MSSPSDRFYAIDLSAIEDAELAAIEREHLGAVIGGACGNPAGSDPGATGSCAAGAGAVGSARPRLFGGGRMLGFLGRVLR